MRFWRTAGALAVGLALGASAVAIGVDTTPPQYTGCLGKDGMLYKVAVGSEPKQACSKTETLISWNAVGPAGEAGLPGANGLSPTVATLAYGDENCWTGGVSVTDAAGQITYVCNGEQGQQGPEGPQGHHGSDGATGMSAYEVAVAYGGFVGTEEQWLDSLQGSPGIPGNDGVDGVPGISPTVVAEPAGTNCQYGGSAVTDASGSTVYACNGAPGEQGAVGAKGDPGEPGGSLASLQGSACTVGGGHGHLSVAVDAAGAVSMTCRRMYTVMVTVDPSLVTPTGSVDFRLNGDYTDDVCTTASCAFEYPAGASVDALFAYDAPYLPACTGIVTQAPEGPYSGTWYGYCSWGGEHFPPFDSDKQITIGPMPPP